MISLTRSAEEVDHYETPSTQDELWAYGHTSTQKPITTTLLHSCHSINFMPGETRYLSSTLLPMRASVLFTVRPFVVTGCQNEIPIILQTGENSGRLLPLRILKSPDECTQLEA